MCVCVLAETRHVLIRAKLWSCSSKVNQVNDKSSSNVTLHKLSVNSGNQSVTLLFLIADTDAGSWF